MAGFPRGGAYSGRPNRFNLNRFAALQESMDTMEDDEIDDASHGGVDAESTRELALGCMQMRRD